jgi:tRNA threonylcarbamoyl adenosine modification protein YjeE
VTWRRHCASADATRAAGDDLARVLTPGDIVVLDGTLGAGKTTFTQGLARGLGVTDRVTSPTFVMVRQHRCGPDGPVRTLHHADIYRVETLGEVIDLGLGELVEEDAVCVVEWGEIARAHFGSDVLEITIVRADDDVRTVTVGGDRSIGRERGLDEWARS